MDGSGATTEMIGFWEINHATNIREFLHAADKIVVPAINLCYADVDGHIALHPCGSLPLRLPGQGRIPMDGSSGDNDWTDMIPRAELPLAVDPKEHFVASANGRPAANGYPHYLGWMWDPSYRIRRINVMLAQADDLTVESMQAVQNDVYDFAAEQFLPVMLAALKQTKIDDDYAPAGGHPRKMGLPCHARCTRAARVARLDERLPRRRLERRMGNAGTRAAVRLVGL